MISLKTGLILGALVVGYSIFQGGGGAAGWGTRIGSSIGGGLHTFGSTISSSFTNALNPGNWFSASEAPEVKPAPHSAPNDISTNTNSWFDQVGDIFSNAIGHISNGFSDKESLNIKINEIIASTGASWDGQKLTYNNGAGEQPLPVNKDGTVTTGQYGLGEQTVAAQRELAEKYNIVTFDTKGNISAGWGI